MSVIAFNDNRTTGSDLHAAILAGLREHAVDVSAGRRRTWRFRLEHPLLGEGTARSEPHWLVIDVPLLNSQPAVDPWELVEFHSIAPAGIKLLNVGAARALTGGIAVTGTRTAGEGTGGTLVGDPSPARILRGELPLDGRDASDIVRRIGDLCGGIVQSAGMLSQAVAVPNESQLESEPNGQPDPAELAALCNDCGWPCESRRAGARFLAKLEVARAPYQAAIEQRRDGSIAAWVDLSSDVMQTQVTLNGGAADLSDDVPTLDEPRRTALAILLGGIADRVHLVRGAASITPAGPNVQLEAVIPRHAVAADLSHALSALSVACECGPEAQLLMSDSRIAELFLARGWSPGRVDAARGG